MQIIASWAMAGILSAKMINGQEKYDIDQSTEHGLWREAFIL